MVARRRLAPLPLAIAAVAAALVAALLWPRGPAPSPAPAAGGPGPVVFLGDSITSGHGLPLAQTFPLRLGRALGVPVVNAGVSGDTTARGLGRLERDVLAHRPRLVVVELGVNDAFHRLPPATTVENLRTITRRLRAAGAAVLLVHFRLPAWGQDGYRAELRAIAREEGAALVEDVLDGIVPQLAPDGLHPGPEGHARLADRLEPHLRALLGAGAT
jgi:acyl-CoA thioesterase-1